MRERDRSPEKDNRAGMTAATLKLIVAFLYACHRWMSVEEREKRRGNIGKLSTMVDVATWWRLEGGGGLARKARS